MVTVAELAEAVYGQSTWHDGERVRAHVLRLRRRLAATDPRAAAVLRTVRGVGFALQPVGEQPAGQRADGGGVGSYRSGFV